MVSADQGLSQMPCAIPEAASEDPPLLFFFAVVSYGTNAVKEQRMCLHSPCFQESYSVADTWGKIILLPGRIE